MNEISKQALDQIFLEARTINKWSDKKIDNSILNRLYEIARLGPTAANSNPARFVFIQSEAAKLKLKPYLAPNNVEKTMSAPIVVIAAFDIDFYNKIPKLFPQMPAAKDWYEKSPDKGNAAGQMNATLGAAYFIIAARAIGLDCGPMSGFDNDGVDKAFLNENGYKSLFLINLGYRDDCEPQYPRLPRLDFSEACEIL